MTHLNEPALVLGILVDLLGLADDGLVDVGHERSHGEVYIVGRLDGLNGAEGLALLDVVALYIVEGEINQG